MAQKISITPNSDQILNEILELKSDLKKYSEQVHNLQATAFFTEFRKNCAEVMINGYRENGSDSIGKAAGNCEHWQKCKPMFGKLLGRLLDSIKTGEVSSEEILSIWKKARLFRSRAPFEHCTACHDEVKKQLDNQIRMLQAIGVYQGEEDASELVRLMPEEESSALFNDALSSPIRIHILKLLYHGGKSFTDLSTETGLRGGNLLFHLEKLQKSGMIHKKGEYLMSYRGYEVLHTVARLFKQTE